MRLVMMGTGTFAEPTFARLLGAGESVVGLVTQPDRGTGRVGGSTRQTGVGLAAMAQAAGVPVAQPESVNTPEGLAQLRALGGDLLVVAAYGQILSPEVIGTPKFGAINVHASLLPKFRGASPVAHAILAGEAVTGVTIIRITPGLDAGEMLAKVAVEIRPDETTGELEARLAPLGADLALGVIQKMKLGPVPGEKQDAASVTKAPKLKKEHGAIRWEQSAAAVCRHVRAMQPWPTAFTFLHRLSKPPLRLTVNRATPTDFPLVGTLGQVLPSAAGTLVVRAGDGAVEVHELQPAGKKRMTAADFLRGLPLEPVSADYFGPELWEPS